jgi:hypothetical protein
MKTLDQPCALRTPLDPAGAAFFWRSKAYTLLKVDITAEDGDGNNVAANPNGSFTPPFSPATPELSMPVPGNLENAEFSEEKLFNSALVVYYRDVIEEIDDEWQLKNFDIKFNLPDSLTGVQWSQKSGPADSGTLIDADKPNAIFRNPTKGGLYEFELTIGGNLLSTFQVWLPTAGPGIEDYWEGEINYFKFVWGPAYRSNLDSELSAFYGRPLFLGEIKTAVSLNNIRKIGINLDWSDLPPRIMGPLTPSGGPHFNGQEERFTLHGVTSGFRKRNNMLYALIGREMGLTEFLVKRGPNIALRMGYGTGSKDGPTTFESYEAGFDLFDGVSLEDVMNDRGRKMMLSDSWDEREWPSHETSSEALDRKAAADLNNLLGEGVL